MWKCSQGGLRKWWKTSPYWGLGSRCNKKGKRRSQIIGSPLLLGAMVRVVVLFPIPSTQQGTGSFKTTRQSNAIHPYAVCVEYLSQRSETRATGRLIGERTQNLLTCTNGRAIHKV